MPSLALGTFLIVCPVSFFLGILFSLFPYDYPLLWSQTAPSAAHYDLVEAHLKLLHNAPNLINRILHIMLGTGIMGLVIKLYKPSESNMLFDGGSLVLYMVATIVYIANILKGLRIVEKGDYGLGIGKLSEEQLDNLDMGAHDRDTGDDVLGREDNLKVLAASNTILALVLVGVLALQIGQWYAERSDEKLKREFRAKERAAAAAAAGTPSSPVVEGSTAAPVKRSGSARTEGRKTK